MVVTTVMGAARTVVVTTPVLARGVKSAAARHDRHVRGRERHGSATTIMGGQHDPRGPRVQGPVSPS